jgi:hypothetical protein
MSYSRPHELFPPLIFRLKTRGNRPRLHHTLPKIFVDSSDFEENFAVCREKIRYLEEGGEETADIQAKYPREPPEIAPPQFTKDQVSFCAQNITF